MNVIREAQEHHRNVELLEGMYICWSVRLSLNYIEKIGRKDASIS